MYCKKCGNLLPDRSKFCPRCGESVHVPVGDTDSDLKTLNDELENGNFVHKFEETKKNKKEGSKSGTLISVVSFIVMILAIGVGKYIIQQMSNNDVSQVQQAGVEDNKVITNSNSWVEFNSTLGGFSVLFPKNPSHETSNLDVPGFQSQLTTEIYSSEQSDGSVYAVNFTLYPDEVNTSVPNNNLEGSVNGTAQDIGGKLISSNFVDFGQYSAIEYLIYKSDGDIYYKGKNILVGKTIYQLIAVYEAKNRSSVQFDKFINSFNLK